jgi:hypothetical protein
MTKRKKEKIITITTQDIYYQKTLNTRTLKISFAINDQHKGEREQKHYSTMLLNLSFNCFAYTLLHF